MLTFMDTTQTKVASPEPLDSARIDHSLMVAALAHKDDIIRRAAWQVRKALKHRQSPTLFEMHSKMALKILGDLGAA